MRRALFFSCVLAVLCLAASQGIPRGPVTVQKKLIDSTLDDIQWADTETVFVLSEQGMVYRSDNGGSTWTKQNAKLHAGSAAPTVRSLYISKVDPNKIFMMGHGSENWVSLDMGKTYQPTQELDLHEVKLHPRQSKWLLGCTMSHGCQLEPKHNCHKLLYVSKDFGKTWHEAHAPYIVQVEWAPYGNSTQSLPTKKHSEAIKPFKDEDPIHTDDLVYATIHDQTAHGYNQRFGMWDKHIHLYHSFDYFKTKSELVKHGNRFLFGQFNYFFVAAVNPHHDTEVSLQVSRTEHVHKKFHTALLPVELTEHSYTVLDTSEGAVFLHVNHAPFDLNAPTGHVYISDWSGTMYSLSLPYNHRSGDGKCDFEKVEGLEGIYLANFIDEADEQDYDDVEIWDDTTEAHKGAQQHKPLKTKTVISFDKGAIWSYLDPPAHDVNGHAVHCEEAHSCHLHLHGITDLYGPFYSSASATGIIMSTGTVGAHLQQNLDKINTYLSRDAGLTWYEVSKGSHIYEFGDHGGLIVMAYDEGETDSILYSWDQGVNWKSLKISENPIQVENIIIEPEAVSQKFIVYGWEDNAGVLIYLDFAELHERVCQGHDAPDVGTSDYETWTVSDGRLDHCLLGHKITYTRRKRLSTCYNPIEHERSSFVEHCHCTEFDFECDYGYYRRLEGGECLRDPDVEVLPDPSEQCKHHHNHYFITKGYRRVPGDTCIMGEKWDRVRVPCPGWLGGSHLGKLMIVLLILVVIGLAVATFYNKSEFVEDCVDMIKSRFERHDYREVGMGEGPYTAADDFGLADEEYTQSAHLMGDGDEEDDEETQFKPLPVRMGRKAEVPTLNPPREAAASDSLLDMDDMM